MRIDGPRRPDPAATRAAARGAGRGESFAVDSSPEARAPSAAGPSLAPSAVGALIALQGAAEPPTGRRKAISRASDMLDLLDDIKLGLLSGGVSRGTLNRLSALVRERREDFGEPGLQGVIDEIDLRAQVELAKLEARN